MVIFKFMSFANDTQKKKDNENFKKFLECHKKLREKREIFEEKFGIFTNN
jgi:hypothetical protein